MVKKEVHAMAIEMDDFFETSSREKIAILQLLNSRKGQYTSVELLMKLLGLSKFKVTGYVNQLGEELSELIPTINLTAFYQGDLGAIEITNAHLIEYKKKYIQTSNIFMLFNEMLVGTVSLENFAKLNYMSRTKSYDIKKKLETILSNSSIEIKEGTLHGPEGKIRKFSFEVYYYFFNGRESVFSPYIMSLKEKLRKSLSLGELSETKKIKLDIFLSICCLRISKGKYVDQEEVVLINQIKNQKLEISKLQKEVIRIFGEKSESRSLSELDFIYSYLIYDEFIQLEDSSIVFQIFSQATNNIDKLLNKFHKKIIFNTTVDVNSINTINKKLTESLYLIFYKYNYSLSYRTTFHSNRQISYFLEMYPQFHSIVLEFIKIEREKEILVLFNDVEVALYYDYMFMLISIVPVQYLQEKIIICVDFSRGETYTNYISENIKAFKNFNIEIQEKIDHKTQIYVSDFMIENMQVKQIIWKNPPSDEDWAFLGDTLTYTKKRAVK